MSAHSSSKPPPVDQPRQIALLGATGSIGSSTLSLIDAHPSLYQVYALSGHSRLDELFGLCQRYRPKRVVVPDEAVTAFAQRLQSIGLDCQVEGGASGLEAVATDPAVDTVVAAIVGSAGLRSTLAAAKAGKRILLANKEALVMAGDLLIGAARDHGAKLLPIDSEHNAIFQCLPAAIQADSRHIHDTGHGVARLWLTASGGPFLHRAPETLASVTVAEAVNHPNWSMGAKISIDSATMMNKALELIEASYLFDLPPTDIEVVIHPQSIVHSLVQYCDGSFLAQLGSPDMRTPIAHALAYPQRIDSGVQALDFTQVMNLHFEPLDANKFSAIRLARSALASGMPATISFNAANEVAVAAFMKAQVKFTDIALIVERVLDKMVARQMVNAVPDIEAILGIDAQARQMAEDEVRACQR